MYLLETSQMSFLNRLGGDQSKPTYVSPRKEKAIKIHLNLPTDEETRKRPHYMLQRIFLKCIILQIICEKRDMTCFHLVTRLFHLVKRVQSNFYLGGTVCEISQTGQITKPPDLK